MISKSALRAYALEARQSIPAARLLSKSRLVEKNLSSREEYRAAKTVATYVSKEDEVQTRELILRMLGDGKRVAVPRVDPDSKNLQFLEIGSLEVLRPGRFGVLEPGLGRPPVPLNRCDLAVVPLIAWDELGHRIGYGKGYFDRALARRGRCLSIGLALESQRVERVPVEPSDVTLDMIVTEKRVLRFKEV